MKMRYFILFFCFFSTLNMSYAVSIKCSDFSKEAKKFKQSAKKKQKDLDAVEKQIQSNKKAVEDYNKNCRLASKPNCNPAMFNIVSGQLSVLSGQREKLTNEIKNDQTKEQNALESYQSCKDSLKKKTI